eukprot:403374839
MKALIYPHLKEKIVRLMIKAQEVFTKKKPIKYLLTMILGYLKCKLKQGEEAHQHQKKAVEFSKGEAHQAVNIQKQAWHCIKKEKILRLDKPNSTEQLRKKQQQFAKCIEIGEDNRQSQKDSQVKFQRQVGNKLKMKKKNLKNYDLKWKTKLIEIRCQQYYWLRSKSSQQNSTKFIKERQRNFQKRSVRKIFFGKVKRQKELQTNVDKQQLCKSQEIKLKNQFKLQESGKQGDKKPNHMRFMNKSFESADQVIKLMFKETIQKQMKKIQKDDKLLSQMQTKVKRKKGFLNASRIPKIKNPKNQDPKGMVDFRKNDITSKINNQVEQQTNANVQIDFEDLDDYLLNEIDEIDDNSLSQTPQSLQQQNEVKLQHIQNRRKITSTIEVSKLVDQIRKQQLQEGFEILDSDTSYRQDTINY